MEKVPIETGAPFYMPMAVVWPGLLASETARGLTSANNNIDVEIFGGLTDLKQAQVQFSLQAGRLPTLWSTEKQPILALMDFVDRVPRPPWPKAFYLRHARRIEAAFLNVGTEPAGTLVFIGEQASDNISNTIVADLSSLGDMLSVGIDSAFTNTAGEQPDRAYSSPMSSDFLLYGFHSDLQRATVKIRDAENRDWADDWTPIWAIAGRQNADLAIRLLRKPYLLRANQSIGVNFQNDADVAEAKGKLWLYGQQLS